MSEFVRCGAYQLKNGRDVQLLKQGLLTLTLTHNTHARTQIYIYIHLQLGGLGIGLSSFIFSVCVSVDSHSLSDLLGCLYFPRALPVVTHGVNNEHPLRTHTHTQADTQNKHFPLLHHSYSQISSCSFSLLLSSGLSIAYPVLMSFFSLASFDHFTSCIWSS